MVLPANLRFRRSGCQVNIVLVRSISEDQTEIDANPPPLPRAVAVLEFCAPGTKSGTSSACSRSRGRARDEFGVRVSIGVAGVIVVATK